MSTEERTDYRKAPPEVLYQMRKTVISMYKKENDCGSLGDMGSMRCLKKQPSDLYNIIVPISGLQKQTRTLMNLVYRLKRLSACCIIPPLELSSATRGKHRVIQA